MLKAAANGLFSVLFPSDCRICKSPLTEISRIPVCSPCVSRVEPLSGILCRACGEKLVSEHTLTADGPLCGICRRAAPPFARAIAYGAYDGELRELVHLLKYEAVHSVAPLLGRYLGEALASAALPEPLVVVPVPLFQRKRRNRGFNQAEEIARAFVSLRRARGIQLETGCLLRTRDTSSQTGLTRHQRRANLRGAFQVQRVERIRGLSVLVVDDVMTTGTTAGECARVLLRAGAKEVFVATVARAIRETPFQSADFAVEAAMELAANERE
ncbi:MAG: ComF family protein [Acidobacteriia bacterium]|nr:ComF family protein [Terriglobia bacterium]